MASVRVSFPSDLEGMLRSEIWNYKTDPPHNGAGFSFCSPVNKQSKETPRQSEAFFSFFIDGEFTPVFHWEKESDEMPLFL